MTPLDAVFRGLLEVLERNGIAVSPATVAALEESLVALAEVLDDHAKQKAKAAGVAEAAGITTEDQAEAAQRKP